jgi:hypothetical protein
VPEKAADRPGGIGYAGNFGAKEEAQGAWRQLSGSENGLRRPGGAGALGRGVTLNCPYA